jgi:ABC-type transport system substrate-binding protein
VNNKEATEASNELKQAGITVKLDLHPDFDEFISYFSAGKAEMYVVDYASDTLDAADIYQTTLPPANYDNPKVNDLLAQANTTLNPATRLKLLQQITVLVDQDVPLVPLGTTSDTWLMNKPYDIRQDSTSGYLPVYFYTVKLK